MAQGITTIVSTMVILLLVAMLATGVSKDERREGWLLVSSTVALIPGEGVLCVAVVAIGARP